MDSDEIFWVNRRFDRKLTYRTSRILNRLKADSHHQWDYRLSLHGVVAISCVLICVMQFHWQAQLVLHCVWRYSCSSVHLMLLQHCLNSPRNGNSVSSNISVYLLCCLYKPHDLDHGYLISQRRVNASAHRYWFHTAAAAAAGGGCFAWHHARCALGLSLVVELAVTTRTCATRYFAVAAPLVSVGCDVTGCLHVPIVGQTGRTDCSRTAHICQSNQCGLLANYNTAYAAA